LLCSQCGEREALEREGSPITFIFGTEMAGQLCRSCATERQALWNEGLLAELARNESGLAPEQIAEIRRRIADESLDALSFFEKVQAALRSQRRSGETPTS
jgi:hypothetical protein